ncbi:MAG: malate dehydrogenase (quinone) [Candidatus Paceibacteria bacterium]|jgi:malate dehydrogenase (quinone)
MKKIKNYDVLIVGGGASGTALFYSLAKYSSIATLALVEKYGELGAVNSNGRNNSQSLHVGDIEMHYSREKAASVKPAAMMVPEYLKTLSQERSDKVLRVVQKMALAVGREEVADMKARFEEFDGLFPEQRMIGPDEIAEVEPFIMKDRDPNEPVLGLFDPNGHAVDYQALSETFVEEAKKSNKNADVYLNHKVTNIKKVDDHYQVEVNDTHSFNAKVVVVSADSYSLLFAKQLGYGEEYSLVPVGANFYYTHEVLKGKVYPMQDRKLPFAGVHGDPDVLVPNTTRWGPTAKFFPVLEDGKWSTMGDYFRSASLGRWKAAMALKKVMFDKTRFLYFLKSAMYDLPYIGKRMFVKNVSKIVPSITASDLRLGKGIGGMRLQRVDVNKQSLELGEGKIIGDHIIFNMTPSPGASVCLFNAMGDGEVVAGMLENARFSSEQMKHDFIDNQKD